MRRPRASLPRPSQNQHDAPRGEEARARLRLVTRWPHGPSATVRYALIVALAAGIVFLSRPLNTYWHTWNESGIRPRALSLWEDVGGRLPCIIDRPPDNAPLSWTPLNEADQRQPSKYGILFVKIDKAGSSTMAGVALRITHALGKRHAEERGLIDLPKDQQMCRARVSHAWSKQSNFRYSDRDKNKSFLFTVLRDPKSRAISEYNYQVGTTGIEPSEESFVSQLRSVRNFQLGLVVDPSEKDRVQNESNKDELSKLVFRSVDEFDFIGILERLDESLVALQFILGLETRDILYSSTKQSGGHILVKSRASNFKGECKRIPKTSTPQAVEEYFVSAEWKHNNMGDTLLYEAASLGLDRIINAIGRNKFGEALAQYRRAQGIADTKCEPTWPCTDKGRVRSGKENVSECYLWDLGCNYRCLDELVF